jgi:peroxiredoxin
MKTTIISMMTGMLCLFAGRSVAQNKQFVIQGEFKNMPQMPAKVYLSEILPSGLLAKTKDSATVTNGKYVLKGELKDDVAADVMITTVPEKYKPTEMFSLFVDKGELNLASDAAIANTVVTGSGATAHHQFDDVQKGTKATTDSIKMIMANPDYSVSKEMQADVQKKSMRILGQKIFDMYSYAKNNPKARVSPYLTYLLVSMPYLQQPGKDTLLQVLPAEIKKGILGQTITKTMTRNQTVRDSLIKDGMAKSAANMSKIAIGSKAVDFTQNTPDGKPISLSSYKGKYVLVDFWASWCKPCREENPNVLKAYNKYKDKGFTVLGVSLDGKSYRAAWEKAIKDDGMPWVQISELNGFENSAAKLYDIKSIPQNFLIDPNGVVVAKNLRGGDLDKQLAAIIK